MKLQNMSNPDVNVSKPSPGGAGTRRVFHPTGATLPHWAPVSLPGGGQSLDFHIHLVSSIKLPVKDLHWAKVRFL